MTSSLICGLYNEYMGLVCWIESTSAENKEEDGGSDRRDSEPGKATSTKASKDAEPTGQEEERLLPAEQEETEEQTDTEESVKTETPQPHVLFHQVEIHEQNGEAVTAAAQLLQSGKTRIYRVYQKKVRQI